MELGASSELLFRLRLVRSARRPLPVAAGSPWPARPPAMGDHIEVTVRGRSAAVPAPGGVELVLSAVALLRTVFVDHHVDPDHSVCLFFHSHLIGTCHGHLDFSVTHRGDAVLLSDFTRPPFRGLPAVPVPLLTFTREVVALARLARKQRLPAHLPAWAQAYYREQHRYLGELLQLAERLVAEGARNPGRFREAYEAVHGHLRRPLELEVLQVETEGDPPPYPVGEDSLSSTGPAVVAAAEPAAGPLGAGAGCAAVPATATIPWVVECRLRFGPIAAGEVLPVRVNGGDVALARVLRFGGRGPVLALWGVSPGGLRPGDRLVGLQCFYP